MPKLLGVGFDNIGHPSARLDGLDLRTSIGGNPKSTVLWLRNGGGKSSIIALLCSVFMPAQHDFVTRGEGRSLEGYVCANGVGVVVSEWTAPGDPEGRTRIIGVAVVKSAPEAGGLKRCFFSFLAGGRRDLLGVHEGDPMPGLPIRRLGGRAASMADFMAWLRQLEKRAPSRDVFLTSTHSEWQKFLEDRNFERSDFRLIAAMNHREGGSSEQLLNFKDDWDFVSFVIGHVYDAEAMAILRNSVGTARTSVSELSGMKSRVVFAEAMRPALLLHAERHDAAATAASGRDQAVAAGLAAVRLLAGAAGACNEKVARADSAQRQSAARALSLADQAADSTGSAWSLRMHAARLDHTAARESATEAALLQSRAERTVAQAACGPALADLRTSEAEKDAAEDALRTAMLPHQETLARLDQARATMGGVLQEEALRQDRILAAAAAEAGRSALAAKAERGGYERASAAAAGCAERSRLVLEQSRAAKAALNVLLSDETLLPAETASAAASRWTVGKGDAEAAGAAHMEEYRAQSEASASARADSDRQSQIAVAADAAAAAIRSLLADHVANRTSLEGHAAIPLLSDGGEAPGLWEGGLLERVEALETRLRATAVARREKTRPAMALADAIRSGGGLLPSSRDAETVVGGLKDLGLNAHHHARYLAAEGVPPLEIGALIASDPARYGGVVVIGAQGFAKVASYQPARSLGGPVQIVSLDAPDLPASSGRHVVGVHPASYDVSVASALVDEATAAASAAEQAASMDDASAAVLKSFHAVLNRFLAAYGEDWHQDREGILAENVRQAEAARGAKEALLIQAARCDLLKVEAFAQAGVSSKLAREAGERLVGISRFQGAFPREQDELVAEAAAIGIQAAAHSEEAQTRVAAEARHRTAEQAARTSESAARDAAVLLRREHASLGRIGGLPEEDVSLDKARADYAMLSELASSHVSDGSLQERANATRSAFSGAAKRLQAALCAATPHLVMAEAEQWAGRPQADVDAARQAVRDAVAGVRAADERVAAARIAEANLADARPGRTKAVDATLTAAAAIQAAKQADAEAAALLEKSADAQAEAVGFAKAREAAAGSQKYLANILAVVPAWARTAAEGVEPDASLDVDEVQAGWIAAAKAHEKAHAEYLRLRADLSLAQDAVTDILNKNGWDSMAAIVGKLREQMSSGRLAANVVENTGSIGQIEEIARIRVEEALKAVGQISVDLDKQVVLVRDMLRKLSKASTVPTDASMGAWAGKPFVEISVGEGGEAEERVAAVKEMVEALCRGAGDLPNPLDLVCQAVLATLRRAPRVTMLKPGVGMDVRRHPVAEVMAASGGEKLTAAILLYSALRKLTGTRKGGDNGGSMLMLDNPIGSCNLPDLLNLQRKVAEACGVQLVFTTGLNDYESIRIFPLLVSLKNEAVNQKSGNRLVETAGESDDERMDMVRMEFRGADW